MSAILCRRPAVKVTSVRSVFKSAAKPIPPEPPVAALSCQKDADGGASHRGTAWLAVLELNAHRKLIRPLAKRLAAGDAEGSRLRDAVGRATSEAELKKGGTLDALRRSPLVGAELDLGRPPISGRWIEL